MQKRPGSTRALAALAAAAAVLAAPGSAHAATTATALAYGSAGWSYQQVAHGAGAGFEKVGYSPAAFWATGPGGFGTTGGTCSWNNSGRVRTGWSPDTDLLLRHGFALPAGAGDVRITGTVDNNADVYVNGALVQHVESGNCAADGISVQVPATALGTDNLIAVRASDAGVETFADLQISYTPKVVPGPGKYVALGDSYASGEGASEAYFGRYTSRTGIRTSLPDPKTNGLTTTGCHRSISAWGYGVYAAAKARGLVDRMDFVACSGATATDLFNVDDTYLAAGEREAPQIRSVDKRTTLVTLSIGGNDANFAKIMKACVAGISAGRFGCRLPDHAGNTLAKEGLNRLTGEGLDVRRPGSTTYLGFGDKMYLSQVYANVALAMAPGGTVIVTGYPRLFAESVWGYSITDGGRVRSCKVGTIAGLGEYRVEYHDAQWLNDLAGQINGAIQRNVDAANQYLRRRGSRVTVAYAPSSGQFTDHRLCSGSKWFNGVQFSDNPVVAGRARQQLQTSLHPSLPGQQAYCRAAVAALPGPKAACSFDTRANVWK